MRPISVEFQAFGPYAGYEKVDFEQLSSNGLFLICGKTGTGKTMILEAITFALYGKSSGNGRDDFNAMRCTNADFGTSTFVRFVFENNGKYYLFERGLERKRKLLDDYYIASYLDDDGVWQPFFNNAKASMLNKKAVEIIGFEYDQFRQVIVLPQGQFEKLLTSNSDEKEKILTNIFGEEKWQKIAEKVLEEAEAKKKALTDVSKRIVNSLSEEGCESIAKLREIIDQKKALADALEEAFKKADYDTLIKNQNESLSLARRFGDLHKAQESVARLEAQKDMRNSWASSYNSAHKAERVRGFLDNQEAARLEYAKRTDELKKLQSSTVELEGYTEKVKKALEDYAKAEPQNEQRKALKLQYEAKKADYANVDLVEKSLAQKTREEAELQRAEKQAEERLERIKEKTKQLNMQYVALNNEHIAFNERYIAEIAGELAEGLAEGERCPVCGSTTHPAKAVKTPESVSKQAVEAKKAEADAKYAELQKTLSEQEGISHALDECKKRVTEKHAEVVELGTRLNGMRASFVEGIASLAELTAAINKLGSEITDFESKRREAADKEKRAEESLAGARAKLEPAKRELEAAIEKQKDADANVAKALETNGFKSAEEVRGLLLSEHELDELRTRVSSYDANIKAARENALSLQKELSGKEEPDIASCQENIKMANAARDEFFSKKSRLSTEVERLSNKASLLEAEGDGIEEKLREAETDLAFAKRLRGDSGTSLKRYVLGIMFSSVITAANKMLELVHDGRYRLFRSDDRGQGSNKRGLELKVYDKKSKEPDGRSVSTLSGGEKFLTSLALSIGMSTIAQKSGIKIEALFIDEGFGSLDESSISDAMNVLSSIQRANGLVGIISHVQLLQDRIPTKLKVVENEEGSHIVQSIG